MQWPAGILQIASTLPRACIICCSFTHNSSSIAKICFCYKRDMTVKLHRNRSTMKTEPSLITLLLGLVCAFFLLFLLFHIILTLLFWTSSFLFMPGEGHKHGRKLNKKQDWSHQELLQKPQPLDPSPSHWEDHRQPGPRLSSFSLHSIWQLSDIKEGGRDSLHSPDCSHSFPWNVEESMMSQSALPQSFFSCMLRLHNA